MRGDTLLKRKRWLWIPFGCILAILIAMIGLEFRVASHTHIAGLAGAGSTCTWGINARDGALTRRDGLAMMILHLVFAFVVGLIAYFETLSWLRHPTPSFLLVALTWGYFLLLAVVVGARTVDWWTSRRSVMNETVEPL